MYSAFPRKVVGLGKNWPCGDPSGGLFRQLEKNRREMMAVTISPWKEAEIPILHLYIFSSVGQLFFLFLGNH